MLDHPLHEEILNIQSKPSLVQLDTVSSHPTTCCLRKETPSLLQPQVVLESDEVSPQLPADEAGPVPPASFQAFFASAADRLGGPLLDLLTSVFALHLRANTEHSTADVVIQMLNRGEELLSSG